MLLETEDRIAYKLEAQKADVGLFALKQRSEFRDALEKLEAQIKPLKADIKNQTDQYIATVVPLKIEYEEASLTANGCRDKVKVILSTSATAYCLI
ncbi:MAG: hypothetical protein IJQ36_04135 [Oscillospiraceae bacterium]|nr:hypothetical protein [Oscillospiraceae bacterium]